MGKGSGAFVEPISFQDARPTVTGSDVIGVVGTFSSMSGGLWYARMALDEGRPWWFAALFAVFGVALAVALLWVTAKGRFDRRWVDVPAARRRLAELVESEWDVEVDDPAELPVTAVGPVQVGVTGVNGRGLPVELDVEYVRGPRRSAQLRLVNINPT